MAGRWSGFVADEPGATSLHEIGNPQHRVRVEHDRSRLYVNVSGEDGTGWTLISIDRETRAVGVGQACTQRAAAEEAGRELDGRLGRPRVGA